MSEKLAASLGAWDRSLRLAKMARVTTFSPTQIANRISDIAIFTEITPGEMPLPIYALCVDARERRERGVDKPFAINTIILAVTDALRTLETTRVLTRVAE